MRQLALLIVLSACNQVFDLGDTQLVDAGHLYFDAPIDAPSMCGGLSEVPRFDQEFHQAVFADQLCTSYQTSAVGLALAICSLQDGNKRDVYEGRVGPLNGMTRANGDLAMGGFIYGLALAPEGNEAYVAHYDVVNSGAGVWHHRRDATGAWTLKDRTAIVFFPGGVMSSVSRGPRRHLLVLETNSQMREWQSDDTGTWSEVRTYMATDLDIYMIYSVDLSQDGLRLIMYGQDKLANQRIFYSYRNAIDDRFGPAVEIPTAPHATDLHLTEDCERMYFSGVGAVFYVRRLP